MYLSLHNSEKPFIYVRHRGLRISSLIANWILFYFFTFVIESTAAVNTDEYLMRPTQQTGEI